MDATTLPDRSRNWMSILEIMALLGFCTLVLLAGIDRAQRAVLLSLAVLWPWTIAVVLSAPLGVAGHAVCTRPGHPR